MKIETKKIKNPKFQHVNVAGVFSKITVRENTQKIETSYIVESDNLSLTLFENIISLQLSTNKDAIDTMHFFINGHSFSILNVNSFSDFLNQLQETTIRDYWKKQELQFFIFLFIRIVVYILSYKKIDCKKLIEKGDYDGLCQILSVQKQLANIFLYAFESANIKSSSYVVTKRAEYLLMLGLDPREQYSAEDIKNISKKYLKIVHPDAILGDTELFKSINTAVQYLK